MSNSTSVSTPTASKRPRSTKREVKTVAIVGLGYVGLPLALLCEQKGYKVIGIDIDRARINSLKTGIAPQLSEAEKKKFKKSKLTLTHHPRTIQDADIVVICVPTPVYKDHKPDLRPLKEAARSTGANLKPGTLVVVESTINPGVSEEVVIPILEKTSGLKVEKDFYFAHCPERINPGDPDYTVATIPRVIGALTKESTEKAESFYRTVLDSDVITTANLKEAESVKMVENAFRDINIAFVNELAMSFDRLGIDLSNVIDAASTKPFGFMPHHPGCGVGGHCIPVDPYYLIDYAKKNGFSHRFIKTAREINNNMPSYTVKRLRQAFGEIDQSIAGAKVALLGLSYKRDVADTRESPALVIAERLREDGAEVIKFDPYFMQQNDYLTLQDTLMAADAVIIATDHSLFRKLTPEILEHYEVDVVIDGRNCLDKEKFATSPVTYRGIGR